MKRNEDEDIMEGEGWKQRKGRKGRKSLHTNTSLEPTTVDRGPLLLMMQMMILKADE